MRQGLAAIRLCMNNHEKEMVARLAAMSLNQARHEIASGAFGAFGSPNYAFCSSLLAAKEAAQRDTREEEALRIARRANKLAIIAIILSALAVLLG
jgi:hypothetical protein